MSISETTYDIQFFLKVTPDLHGCPPVSSGKKNVCAILKEIMSNYISLESLINEDFSFFNSTKENCKNDSQNDHASFN